MHLFIIGSARMDIEADWGKGNCCFFFKVQLVQAEVRCMLE